MQNCSCCFEDWIGPCNGVYDNVTINTALSPGGVYSWRITDKFSKIYQGETTADDDGKIIIPCSELPDFLFTPYSGIFTIEILDGSCKPIKFMLASEYDCVTMTINGGNSDKREIGCEMAIAGGGSSTGKVEFVDDNHVTIDWSQFIDTFGNDPVIQVYIVTEGNGEIYELVAVEILQIRNGAGILQTIEIDLGGPADGYVLIT